MAKMKLIGKVKDAHGMKGELYILLFGADLSWLSKLKNFGLGELPARGRESTVEPIVYQLSLAKEFKKGLILKSADIVDRTAAEKLVGRGFYVPTDFFVAAPTESIYLGEMSGFALKNPAGETLGTIVDFSTNGAQDLLVVKTVAGEAEVPFVDAFIRKIDRPARVIVMELPEGLLDLSLATEAGDAE